MTVSQIVEEIQKLTYDERLVLMQVTLHLVKADLYQAEQIEAQSKLDERQLADSAKIRLNEYLSDKELTAHPAPDSNVSRESRVDE